MILHQNTACFVRLWNMSLDQCFSTFLSLQHTLHQKKFGGTPKTSKIIKITSKNSCFTLNKLKLANLQTTKTLLMHTGLTVFLNIGSKIRKKILVKNLVAHFLGAYGTLECRGTPVEKHWSRLIQYFIELVFMSQDSRKTTHKTFI